jgi:predicted nucleic acid-binding protein
MIVLDTNVVSEPMRVRPDPAVTDWLDAQSAETLFVTALNIAELMLGVRLLAEGKRRQVLSAALGAQIRELFGPRILSFDERAAEAYADLIARLRGQGRSLTIIDGQIAAIATVHGFAVATRDVEPFESAGLTVINPWAAQS